ncbi:MAG: hypothetical protein U0J70_12915, partial [Atopobiaceae bacterium]|nr:hypothetical protein [Atopobiaceae bacterium]
MTSAVSDVIVGYDGWLYYEGELNDYWRKETLTDTGIENAATNLSLIQESLLARGKHFVLAIAPNKSTLFPDGMPYYYVRGEGPSIYERLHARLAELEVNAVDLMAELEGKRDTYFLRDSHWNEEGALIAFDAIRDGLGYQNARDWGAADDVLAHTGDLDAMLHPLAVEPETLPHRTTLDAYAMANDAQSVEDAYIVTTATGTPGGQSLLMYRDSFANNLMLSFASTYRSAVFTKNVPYNLGDEQVGFAQDVVIERAERHIASFATDPPYMYAPKRAIATRGHEEGPGAVVRVRDADPYIVIEGSLGRDLQKGERVYVEVAGDTGESQAYEAFRVSEPRVSASDFEGQGAGAQQATVIQGDRGFRAYVPKASGGVEALGQIRLFVGTEQSCREIATEAIV